jgi:hypothetical protein
MLNGMLNINVTMVKKRLPRIEHIGKTYFRFGTSEDRHNSGEIKS